MFTRRILPLLRYGTRASLCKTPPVRVSACGMGRVYSTGVTRTGTGGVVETGEAAQELTTNKPFAKNLYLGKYDVHMIQFPEVLDNEELADLDMMIQPIEKFFKEDLDSAALDQDAKIPDDVLQQVKDLGLFGLQIPQKYGGLELNATQFARICEFTSLDPSIGVTLAAHQSIGLKGILIVGTDAQKEKYLPTLSTGEKVAAFALTEAGSGSDAASIQTRATLSEDGSTFHITGSKIWISNGGFADLFTVFAKTEVKQEDGSVKDKITAFLVERDFGGVSNGKPEDKLGIRASNTCEVYFDNTPVPVENVLGEVGGGFKVAMAILNSGRFSMGSSVAGGLRHIIGLTCDYAKSRTQFGKPIAEFGLIQEKFARMAVYAYAMESMAYRTAAILDLYDSPDASVEAAMVKVFSSEHGWELVSEGLQVLGGIGYTKQYPFERYLRDARILLIFEGTNEILRLYIGLTGLQYAGKELKDILVKMKNPFNNMGFIYKRTKERIAWQTKMKKELQLQNRVHPTLGPEAEMLVDRLIKFRQTVEKSLQKYKTKIAEEQMVVKRLADVSIEMYAMTSVLGRASRSKSIGLKNCDHEIMLAQTFCKESCERVDSHFKQLSLGKFKNCDKNYEEIAQAIFDNEGYVAEHPLKRNW